MSVCHHGSSQCEADGSVASVSCRGVWGGKYWLPRSEVFRDALVEYHSAAALLSVVSISLVAVAYRMGWGSVTHASIGSVVDVLPDGKYVIGGPVARVIELPRDVCALGPSFLSFAVPPVLVCSCFVKFPEQEDWEGMIDELQLVAPFHGVAPARPDSGTGGKAVVEKPGTVAPSVPVSARPPVPVPLHRQASHRLVGVGNAVRIKPSITPTYVWRLSRFVALPEAQHCCRVVVRATWCTRMWMRMWMWIWMWVYAVAYGAADLAGVLYPRQASVECMRWSGTASWSSSPSSLLGWIVLQAMWRWFL